MTCATCYRTLGLDDAKVLIVGNDSVRVQSADLKPAQQDKVTAALGEVRARSTPGKVSVNNVGPTWGDKVSSKALTALIVFFFVIAGYLTLRFEWRMALAAIIAVIHDIIITVGVYAVTGFEVTPATVVAFLTILGFSLYDTVVVFDKVKDNTARLGTVRGDTYSSMVNRSLNQVLMRSINTSIVALLPVASLLFVGTYAFGGLALARLRAGPVRRSAHRCVLVDLRGHAGPRVAQGAPAPLPRAARAGRGRPGQGRRGGARSRRSSPVSPPTCRSTARTSTSAATTTSTRPVGSRGARALAPAPARRAAPRVPRQYGATRGAANPRGRQQRGKKKKR